MFAAVIIQLLEDNIMLSSINYQHPKTPLESTMVTVLQELERRKYPKESLYRYSRIFRHLLQFAFNTGLDQFSEELISQFLQDYRAAKRKKGHGLTKRMRDAVCGIRMLSSFALTGTCPSFRPCKSLPVMPKTLAPQMDSFLHYWKHERNASWKTLDYGRWALSQFILFAHSRGVRSWSDVRPELCTDFFADKAHLSPRSLKLIANVLRVFFRYHFTRGTITRDWSHHVPQFRGFRNQRIPAIWPEAAVKSLLVAVDRSRPKGKRDYAILLLACRLGMRAGDIRDLQLDNLNWDDSRIEFRQSKTGRKTIVPLTNEIGEALIDYLQNGRPATDYREIFLRAQVPYTPLLKGNKLYGIVEKYRILAGIELPQQAKGMHSLRHTVASRLLNAGNSLETISDILGHASLDTTRIYTRVGVEQLRCAALDPEESIHA